MTVFYSDPVQLNLLYEQAKEAILDGTHPVPLETAVQFGAIQVQIQFGDHKEDKHKPLVDHGMMSRARYSDHLITVSYHSYHDSPG